MAAYVVDTNVPVVANHKSPQASARCVLDCIRSLRAAMESMVCIDDGMRILDEYMRNLSMSGQPGVGDAFMKWVHQNQAVATRCERVRITPQLHDAEDFVEFPASDELQGFDRSDRKFAAVALSSSNSPIVLNAVDSDWWNYRHPLAQSGVKIDFICKAFFGSQTAQ